MPATEPTKPDPASVRPVPRHGWAMSAAIAATVTAMATLTARPPTPLQIVEASDGVSVEAILSIKEPTRIRIDGRRSPTCSATSIRVIAARRTLPATPGMSSTAPGGGVSSAINPAGEIVLECDRDKGEIYSPGRRFRETDQPVRLVGDTTYTLLLRRADTPADTIVIRDKTPGALRAAGAAQAGRAVAQPGPAQ